MGRNWFYQTATQEQLCGFWQRVSLYTFLPSRPSWSLLRCLQRYTKLPYEKKARLTKLNQHCLDHQSCHEFFFALEVCSGWHEPKSCTGLRSWLLWYVFPWRTAAIKSHKSSAGIPSNLNPASKEIISDSECWTNVWLRKCTMFHLMLILNHQDLREDCSRPKRLTPHSRKCEWDHRTNPRGRWRWRTREWKRRWERNGDECRVEGQRVSSQQQQHVISMIDVRKTPWANVMCDIFNECMQVQEKCDVWKCLSSHLRRLQQIAISCKRSVLQWMKKLVKKKNPTLSFLMSEHPKQVSLFLWCCSFHELRYHWQSLIYELHQRSFHRHHEVLDDEDEECHLWYWWKGHRFKSLFTHSRWRRCIFVSASRKFWSELHRSISCRCWERDHVFYFFLICSVWKTNFPISCELFRQCTTRVIFLCLFVHPNARHFQSRHFELRITTYWVF